MGPGAAAPPPRTCRHQRGGSRAGSGARARGRRERAIGPAALRRTRARRGEGELLRGEILEAVGRLLLETHDEESVSIRAIADLVGVTPPSIYRHFADKEELLLAVCEEAFLELDQRGAAAEAGVDDPYEALGRRGRAYVQFGLEHPEHYRMLFVRRHDADARERVQGAACFGHLVDAVQRAMDAGRMPVRDPFLVATGLWATVHGLTSLLLSMPDFPWPDLGELVDHVVDTHCRGLRLPPDD